MRVTSIGTWNALIENTRNRRWQESKRTNDGDIIATFSQLDGSPIFITKGALLACVARWSLTIIGLKLSKSVPGLKVDSHTHHYCPHSQTLSQVSIATRMPFHLRVTPNIAQVSIYIIHIPKVEEDGVGQSSLFYKTTQWQDPVLSPNLEIWKQMAQLQLEYATICILSVVKGYRHIKCGLAETQQKLSIST